MTRRTRTFFHGLIAFIICVVLIVSTAYLQGADPFHPRSRHIWAATLLAALYVSFRGALLVERMTGSQRDNGAGKFLGLFRKDHAIDRRMAERKARVDAAQQRIAGTSKKTGDGHDNG